VDSPIDPGVLAAARRSSLGDLPRERIEALLVGSRLVDLARGGDLHPEGAHPPPLLVVHGLIRVFRSAPDGRRITVRYARAGELLAIAYQFASIASPMPGGAQALAQTRVVILDGRRLVEEAHRDASLANALLVEASNRSISFEAHGAELAFASVRQRVALNLLDIATVDGEGPLAAHITQQDLADAVGSLREVVVRILHDLRDERLIKTSRNEILIVDPVRLHGNAVQRSL